jgi:hypothetical protein
LTLYSVGIRNRRLWLKFTLKNFVMLTVFGLTVGIYLYGTFRYFVYSRSEPKKIIYEFLYTYVALYFDNLTQNK